jgi:hypothetical protein
VVDDSWPRARGACPPWCGAPLPAAIQTPSPETQEGLEGTQRVGMSQDMHPPEPNADNRIGDGVSRSRPGHATFYVAFFLLLALTSVLLVPREALAAATVTPATGGGNLTVGTFAPLSGPSLAEGATGDIGLGDIVLQAPAGFQFDPSQNVTATVVNQNLLLCTGVLGVGNPLLLNGASSQTVTPTTSQIKVTVTRKTSVLCRATINWSGIRVKATASGSANITKAPGGSAIIGVVNGTTNFGTLSAAPVITLTLDTTSADFGTGLGPDGSPSSLPAVVAYPSGNAGAFYVRHGAAGNFAVSVTVDSTDPYTGSVSATENTGTAGMRIANNDLRWSLGDMGSLATAQGGTPFTTAADGTVLDNASSCASGAPKQQGQCTFSFDYSLLVSWTDAPGTFSSVVTYSATQ